MENLYQINNVCSGDFFSEIKSKYREHQRNNMLTWEAQCFDEFPGATVTYFDKDYVSNIISIDFLQQMNADNSLFVISQTGSGKTTFIFDKIIPSLEKSNKKVLYLCSRVSLANQIKAKAISDENTKYSRQTNCLVKDMKKYYSDFGIQEQYDFGTLHIITYHRFNAIYESLDFNNYAYVVFDETHFFLSDAVFNAFTQEIWNKLCQKAKNTRRIYLTATPDDVLDMVWSAECFKKNHYCISNLSILYSPENYSYLNPKFFSNEKDIIQKIMENSEEKWLIFVNSKKQGEELTVKLCENNVTTKFISSETDKNDEDYKKLLNDSSLPVRCLIATKIIDVGVNIIDKKLNLVLYESDIVEQKQMIGRKRVETGETVNAYFYVPSIKELTDRLNILKKRIGDYIELIDLIKNGMLIDKLEHPFYLKGGRVYYNEMFYQKINKEKIYYNGLLRFVNQFKTDDEQRMAYAQWILKNYDGVTFKKEDLFFKSTEKDLKILFDEYIGKELERCEFDVFSKRLKGIIGDVRVKPRDTTPAVKTVNSSIKNYGYRFDTYGDPTKYKLLREENDDNV